jgi:hypothetical protein
MHQFIQAGICLYNPDNRERPVNSSKAVYQIAPAVVKVLRAYGTSRYKRKLQEHLSAHKTLAAMYAKEREMAMVPLKIKDGVEISLSAGDHSLLSKAIVEQFAPRFVCGGTLVYVGDAGDKYGFFDVGLLTKLGVVLDNHGKLPDVVIYDAKKNWLFLIESVTSHGPVDSKRHTELEELFAGCTAGRVFVSAFPNRKNPDEIPGGHCLGNGSVDRLGPIAPGSLQRPEILRTIRQFLKTRQLPAIHYRLGKRHVRENLGNMGVVMPVSIPGPAYTRVQHFAIAADLFEAGAIDPPHIAVFRR